MAVNNTGKRKQQTQRKLLLTQQALEMRIKGRTLREIGTALGVDASYVKRLLDAGLAEAAKQSSESAAELRTIQLQRLELAVRAISDAVERGDLPAVDRWVRIIEVQARYLGVPVVQESTGSVKIEVEYLNNWRNGDDEGLPPDSSSGSALDTEEPSAV